MSEQFTNLIQKTYKEANIDFTNFRKLSFVETGLSITTVFLDYFYGPKSNINVLKQFVLNYVYVYGYDGYCGDIKANK